VIEKVEDRLSRILPFLHWKNLAMSAMHGYVHCSMVILAENDQQKRWFDVLSCNCEELKLNT